jgi:hypothetical protein
VTVVRYLRSPAALFIELEESLDGIQREVQISSLDGGASLGDDIVDGMVVQREKLAGVRVALYQQAADARDAGEELVDLEAEYPDDLVDQVLAVIAAARQTDAAASDGRLLTPPISDELARFRSWVFDQCEVQLRGGEPTPFDPTAR